MPLICPGCNSVLDPMQLRCAKCNATVVHCPKCRGTGQEVMVSFFSHDMTQDVSIPCRKCGGEGVLCEPKLAR